MDLPEYAIEAKGLYKIYAATKTTPEKLALNGVDLQIPRGSIFGLLGPNGAGKSTFINILAGLTRKTSGSVKIWNVDIDAHPRDARAATEAGRSRAVRRHAVERRTRGICDTSTARTRRNESALAGCGIREITVRVPVGGRPFRC